MEHFKQGYSLKRGEGTHINFRGTTMATTRILKSCVTKEDLDQNRIIKGEEEDEPGFVTTVVTNSSSKLVLERTCPSPHASTSRMAMEAKTPGNDCGKYRHGTGWLRQGSH